MDFEFESPPDPIVEEIDKVCGLRSQQTASASAPQASAEVIIISDDDDDEEEDNDDGDDAVVITGVESPAAPDEFEAPARTDETLPDEADEVCSACARARMCACARVRVRACAHACVSCRSCVAYRIGADLAFLDSPCCGAVVYCSP